MPSHTGRPTMQRSNQAHQVEVEPEPCLDRQPAIRMLWRFGRCAPVVADFDIDPILMDPAVDLDAAVWGVWRHRTVDQDGDRPTDQF